MCNVDGRRRANAFLVSSLIAISTLTFAGLARAQTQSYTMKIGMVTINDPIHAVAIQYGKEIERRSSGRIKAEIYPAGQLGKAARMIEGLQSGTQEVLVSPPAFLAGIVPGVQVLDAPGFFRSMDHAYQVVTRPVFRDHLMKLPQSKGIVGTSIWVYGPSTVASTKAVDSAEQLRGFKVRILATDLERAVVDSMGMKGVPMDFTEALPALQNGTIDACRTGLVVMGGMKFYNTAKYAFRDETGMVFSAVWVSDTWLKRLPADLQKVVVDVGRDMDTWGTQNAKEAELREQKTWADAGAKITSLSPEQRAKLFATVAPLGEKLLGGNAKTVESWRALQAAAGELPK
jgi:TRAP-type C4-dicarboxylate transport system substrate-binding protein